MSLAWPGAIKADGMIIKKKTEIVTGNYVDATYKDLRQVTVGRKPQSSQALGIKSKAPHEDGC